MIIDKPDQATLGQIIERGDESISHIECQIVAANQRVIDADNALKALSEARESRLKQLIDVRNVATGLQDSYNRAVTFAKLAHDTPNESYALKGVNAAKKDMNAAQKHLAQLEAKNDDAKKDEQVRENELLDQLNKAKSEALGLQEELHKVKHARGTAGRQLAEQKHAAHIQADDENAKRIDELKTQLVEIQAKRLDAHENALQDLADYPDLQRDIAQRRPLEDHVTRAIDASLFYAETYLREIRDLAPGWQVKLPSLTGGNHILDAIMVTDAEILRARQDRRGLEYRRDLISKMQAEYRAYLEDNL